MLYHRGPKQGTFRLYLDGRQLGTVNGALRSDAIGRYRVAGLPSGSHVVQVVVVGPTAIDRFVAL